MKTMVPVDHPLVVAAIDNILSRTESAILDVGMNILKEECSVHTRAGLHSPV